MANVRVMFVGQGVSGLPEDRCVNVFHFSGSGTYEADSVGAAAKVNTFYTGVGGSQSTAIGSFLSPWIQRQAELRTYDLSQPKPRVPTIYPFELPAVLSNNGLPEEVALVTTFYGEPPVTRRRRGRLYIGPLNSSTVTITGATSTTPTTPGSGFINDLMEATKSLSVLSNPQFCVRSSLPSENFVMVRGGYVDNAFDTQRRRGPDPTARSSWTNIILP